jgi:hypothetical protein
MRCGAGAGRLHHSPLWVNDLYYGRAWRAGIGMVASREDLLAALAAGGDVTGVVFSL